MSGIVTGYRTNGQMDGGAEFARNGLCKECGHVVSITVAQAAVFSRYIQSVHANKSPLKIWENREHGTPKFFEYPLLSQERIKLRTSNLAGIFTGSIRTKAL